MFGIFQCPYCGGFQGYEIRIRTSKCHSCGNQVIIKKSITYGPYDDQNSMRGKIWDLKSGSMNETEISLNSELLSKDTRSKDQGLSRTDKEKLVSDLLKGRSLTFNEIFDGLTDYGISTEELSLILERLVKSNQVFSPRYGIFRNVD